MNTFHASSPGVTNLRSQAKHAPALSTEGGEEVLCDTLFSLAYGALLLLSHTTLRLIRGRRYGILGTNGSGKSTLMRQLRDGKVENFPPQSELRCVMVEHSLQGEDTSLSIIDFVASGSSSLPAFQSLSHRISQTRLWSVSHGLRSGNNFWTLVSTMHDRRRLSVGCLAVGR